MVKKMFESNIEYQISNTPKIIRVESNIEYQKFSKKVELEYRLIEVEYTVPSGNQA